MCYTACMTRARAFGTQVIRLTRPFGALVIALLTAMVCAPAAAEHRSVWQGTERDEDLTDRKSVV